MACIEFINLVRARRRMAVLQCQGHLWAGLVASHKDPTRSAKNKHENVCPAWGHTSFQTDKNRYYTWSKPKGLRGWRAGGRVPGFYTSEMALWDAGIKIDFITGASYVRCEVEEGIAWELVGCLSDFRGAKALLRCTILETISFLENLWDLSVSNVITLCPRGLHLIW